MSPDERIEQLLAEVEEVRALSLGSPDDHRHPDLVRWYARAKAAIADKVGEDSHIFQGIAKLQFWSIGGSMYEDPTPGEYRQYFSRDVDQVVGALTAALEAREKRERTGQPLVQVSQHQEGASASATAVARVDVMVGVAELRVEIANAPGLTPEERGAAMAAVPADDDEVPTLEKVSKLLEVATKAKSLLKPVLGWILKNADRIEFPI